MRSLPFALLTALLAGPFCAGMPVRAQEPLLLHIRPDTAPLPEGGGAGQTLSSAEVADRARAAREAVWQRAERRARIAIASVCTGCIAPDSHSAPLPAPPNLDPIRSADATPPDPRPPTEGDL